MDLKRFFVPLLLVFLCGATVAYAQVFSSGNFILHDSVLTIEGGRSASLGFQYFSATGETVSGKNTAASFTQEAGFEFFPTATSAVVAATAGNGQVSLSWTAAVGTFANIEKYLVGTASTSGGPYTFQDVGNVTSFIKTGLTNGTPYFFVIKAQAGGENLSASAQVSSTPTGPAPAPGPSSGGGGGGYTPPTAGATVTMSGRAYPLSHVTVLKDGQLAVTTIAGPDARFEVSLTYLSAGTYNFLVYGEDTTGQRSTPFTFPVTVTENSTTTIGGIFLAPTIDVDKAQVVRGDNIAIFGQSVPQADVTISVHSDPETFVKAQTDQNGAYLYNFDTAPLDFGDHVTKAKAALDGEISPFGTSVSFLVGGQTVPNTPHLCPMKADLNGDCRVNLVDFSIAAYWYKRPLSSGFALIDGQQLTGDGKIDLVDFSIMAYYWTG